MKYVYVCIDNEYVFPAVTLNYIHTSLHYRYGIDYVKNQCKLYI